MTLDELLGRGTPAIGTWSQVASPEVVDMIGTAGYDFSIIDCEHGCFGIETAENLFRACDANGIVPLCRVPAVDPVAVSRALDAGAAGVVVPGVSSVAEARSVIDASRFAPDGSRGACPAVRSAGQFTTDWPGYVTGSAGNGVIILVENIAGLSVIEEICALPGLKALLVGPFDLSVSMGLNGDYRDAAVNEALKRMLKAAKAAGVPVIFPVFAPALEDARALMAQWRAEGADHFVIGTDKIIITDALRRYAEGLRIAG